MTAGGDGVFVALEASALIVLGVTLVAVGLVALARRRQFGPAAASLLVVAGLSAIGWRGAALLGYSEDVHLWVEALELAYFAALGAAFFVWGANVLTRYSRALSSANEDLNRSLEMKDTFIDVLSHDLRNPIAGARGNLELHLRQASGDTERLERIHAELGRAESILEQALTYGRVQEKNDLDDRAVPLDQLVADTVDELESEARRCDVELDAEVPTTPRRHVHPVLTRALENLLTNAIEWSPEGETVRVAFDPDTDQLRIADRGPGIPEDERDDVFEKFVSAEDQASDGAGLGLSITADVAELVGADLWIEDTPGGGSTFVLDLSGHGTRPSRKHATGAPAPAGAA